MARINTFTARDLLRTLKDLGALVATPEGRQLIADELENSIRRSKAGGAMLDKIRLMYDYFRDPAEPVKPKLLIGAALLYLIIPTDLIPDWIAFIGLTDDFAAIAIVYAQLKDVLTNYEGRRRKRLAAAEASA